MQDGFATFKHHFIVTEQKINFADTELCCWSPFTPQQNTIILSKWDKLRFFAFEQRELIIHSLPLIFGSGEYPCDDLTVFEEYEEILLCWVSNNAKHVEDTNTFFTNKKKSSSIS